MHLKGTICNDSKCWCQKAEREKKWAEIIPSNLHIIKLYHLNLVLNKMGLLLHILGRYTLNQKKLEPYASLFFLQNVVSSLPLMPCST